ncbi:MAG: YiiX/YebB-like N1pC/P60 family cysteine hydrolase [Firmicutes bacterium]|nr:YiiX/YebB-like N1pC/P60 family cysteine hydrolase [Bacillota bacterium]
MNGKIEFGKTAGHPTRRLWVFPAIFMILLIFIGCDNRQLLPKLRESVIYTYIQSLGQGRFGTGYGYASTERVSFAELEPGDIVLGGWPNCAYGRFSHVGLYIGGDQVLEGYGDYGLTLQDLDHYRNYSEMCLLRVEASREVKNMAVDYALARQGQMFYPVAFKSGERFWNCSKIIWRAYKNQGIDLDELGDVWIAPESFMDSRYVKILYEKGMQHS